MIGHLYLSGVVLGVHVRMHTKKTNVQKKSDYMFKIHVRVQGSIVNIIKTIQWTIQSHQDSSL